ncbi:MAG: transcriptional regulator [Nitrososphaerales archaeon]
MGTRPGRAVGIAIFVACMVGFIVYAWLLLVSEWSPIVLQLTALAAVGGLLGILAWIGLNMATARASAAEQEKIGSSTGLSPEEKPQS